MPFPPTPSITPSNTPTSSVTPSNTPTNTPSGTQCPGLSPTPTNTMTTTPTITPSSTPCPCVCGAEVINNNEFSITYSYVDCYDITYSGTIAGSSTLILPCIEPTIYVKFGSITTSATAIITYGACITPVTPTPTATNTPTISVTPTLTATNTLTPTPTSTPPCLSTNYLLFNETASPLSWTGLDCAGNGVGDTIPGGQQANTGCIQNGTLVEGSLTIVSSTPC
jgi:hypothetical protein